MKTVLDRADCADFGCHNSIRLETKHFLNTLALTFISFSGRFVFAMQKHYLFFFASDPLVYLLNLQFCHLMPSRSQTMWLIWRKFYLGTHYYILLTYTKNQDLLRLKLFFRPIKTILRLVFFTFFPYFPL